MPAKPSTGGGFMLQLSNLAKRYGDVVALDGCSFAIQPGRLTGFLGPNGAGKTTAMRAVFGLVHPDAGDISWQGRPVTPAERLHFGYMPEERGVYPKMRVAEQVAYFAELSGLSRSAARTAAAHWLDALGLADRGHDRVEALSHGNQQRVQLAIALVHDPVLLLLDEPFSGLDPIAVEGLITMLRKQAADGVGVLFSSHQLDLVEDLCEDVVIIDHGSVVLSGSVEHLRSAATTRVVELAFDGAVPAFDDLAGAVLTRLDDRHLRLVVDRATDPASVLRSAGEGAEITRMSYQPPDLSDLFREAVQR
jgi:ABC-2 type transport system ATP-binding protein